MKKEFRDLFYSEKYDDIVKDTKLLINNKPNDAELWYCLFLAENTNYIDIDFENINNEICFNKAIQLANKRQREEFNSEYLKGKSYIECGKSGMQINRIKALFFYDFSDFGNQEKILKRKSSFFKAYIKIGSLSACHYVYTVSLLPKSLDIRRVKVFDMHHI